MELLGKWDPQRPNLVSCSVPRSLEECMEVGREVVYIGLAKPLRPTFVTFLQYEFMISR